MIINTKKYSIKISDKGEIISLISGEKQFVKNVLPLLRFQLRKNEQTKMPGVRI